MRYRQYKSLHPNQRFDIEVAFGTEWRSVTRRRPVIVRFFDRKRRNKILSNRRNLERKEKCLLLEKIYLTCKLPSIEESSASETCCTTGNVEFQQKDPGQRKERTDFETWQGLHHHRHHLSLNREGRWCNTEDFSTSFLHLSLFSIALWDLANYGLSIPWCCLSTSSSVCLDSFPLSLCLARWFWPVMMNGRHDHTTAVCVSLQWSGGLRVVRLPAGSWHGLSC